MKGDKKMEIDDDLIILVAGLGAALTAYGAAKGAAEVADSIGDFVQDAAGDISAAIKNPVVKLTSFLGANRKGGIL